LSYGAKTKRKELIAETGTVATILEIKSCAEYSDGIRKRIIGGSSPTKINNKKKAKQWN
jgi:hypothetical protein